MLKHIEIAKRELGTTEIPGAEDNPRIVKYGKGTTKDDETPWCSYFVSWVCEQAGLPFTNKGTARSWLEIGNPVEKPKVGDVVVYWRGKKDGWQGHVGFYMGENNGKIKTLGGNQRNKVSISEYGKDRVLGYRRLIETKPTITMKDFGKGFRTYTGIIILLLGALGLGDLAADPSTAEAINQIMVAVGTLVGLYGRYNVK